MPKSTAYPPPPEFFSKLAKELSERFPNVGEANVLLLLHGGCDLLVPKKKDASVWPTSEEEALLRQKCIEWIGLGNTLKTEFPEFFLRDILILILREARILKRKKIEDKENKLLKTRCMTVLDFRRNDPEKDRKAALRRNEETAWKQVYKEYRSSIKGLLRTKGCHDETTQEEILGNATFGLLKNLADPDYWLDTSVKSYLITLALRNWFKRVRDEKKVGELSDFTDDDVGEEGQIFDEVLMEDFRREEDKAALRLDIEVVLEKLENLKPDSYRDILKARLLDLSEYEEIAKQFKTTEGNVRIITMRALKKLKDQLGNNFLHND